MEDSLQISQNEDGSYTLQWDPKDQNWNWLAKLTSEEIGAMIQEGLKEKLNDC